MSNLPLRQQIAASQPAALACYDALAAPALGRMIDAAITVKQVTTAPTANGALFKEIMQDLITYGPQLAQLILQISTLFCLLVAISIGAETKSPRKIGQHVDAKSGTVHKLGLKPLKPGAYARLKADLHHKTLPINITPTITPVDLRPKCPPVLDQDGWNCCAACSGTMGHRLATILAGKPDPSDSVADLYDQVDGGIDEGADLSDCITTMTSTGVAPTSLVPQWELPVEKSRPGLAAARTANRLVRATFLPDDASMLAAVESGCPVYFGIIVTNRFNPDQSGYIGPYGGLAEGGHAVLAIGVTATADGYAYIVRNSWGQSWGNSGNCILDHTWAQPTVYGAFSMCQQPSKRGRPTRSVDHQQCQGPCPTGQCPVPTNDVFTNPRGIDINGGLHFVWTSPGQTNHTWTARRHPLRAIVARLFHR